MKNKALAGLGAGLVLLSMLTGCGGLSALSGLLEAAPAPAETAAPLPAAESAPPPSETAGPADGVSPEVQAQLDAQLGLLTGYLTAAERQAALDLWLEILPLREARLAAGTWTYGSREERLLRALSRLYDQYTVKYLGGDELGFGYTYPEEVTLISYRIGSDGTLTADGGADLRGWTEEELLGLWEDMLALLPEGAFADFERLTFFTDGPDETVAWVWQLDEGGEKWEIAVDPADAGDRLYFVETVLHEYCHYLTLNSGQAEYTWHQTTDTYNEPGLAARPGSYLDDFYQTFWTGYIDDCRVCYDTYNFFLRHYDDFITAYASTNPSEDICESFTFFVLRPRDPMAFTDVWSRKLDFFYDYPELVEFRAAVRANLDLDEWTYYEDLFPDDGWDGDEVWESGGDGDFWDGYGSGPVQAL